MQQRTGPTEANSEETNKKLQEMIGRGEAHVAQTK